MQLLDLNLFSILFGARLSKIRLLDISWCVTLMKWAYTELNTRYFYFAMQEIFIEFDVDDKEIYC
jgi:hypothetical protein